MFETAHGHRRAAFACTRQPELVLEEPVHPVGFENSTEFDPFEKFPIGTKDFHAAQIYGLLINEINAFDRDEEFVNLHLGA